MRKIMMNDLKNRSKTNQGKNVFIIFIGIDDIEEADIDQLEKARQDHAVKNVSKSNSFIATLALSLFIYCNALFL
jgi:hypothetical protein